jgi:hypothetical protein
MLYAIYNYSMTSILVDSIPDAVTCNMIQEQYLISNVEIEQTNHVDCFVYYTSPNNRYPDVFRHLTAPIAGLPTFQHK